MPKSLTAAFRSASALSGTACDPSVKTTMAARSIGDSNPTPSYRLQSLKRSVLLLLLLLQLTMRYLSNLANVLTLGAPASTLYTWSRIHEARAGGGEYLADGMSSTVPYDSNSTIAMGSVRWGGSIPSHQSTSAAGCATGAGLFAALIQGAARAGLWRIRGGN